MRDVAVHLVTSAQSARLADLLAAALASFLPPRERAWLSSALELARAGSDRTRFLACYAGAARRLRAVSATPRGEAIAALERQSLLASAVSWPPARMARAALLMTIGAALDDEERCSLVGEAFRTGDNDERVAVVGVLALLPGGEAHLAVALEACRSNVATVFEGIACDNPYPADYFPDLYFNQMVLKALFTGVALARINGLDRRRGGELARMAGDYAAERRAAGRPVPDDIGLAIGAVEDTL